MLDDVFHIERELMLISRHQVMAVRQGKRPEGWLDRSAYTLLSRLEAAGPMSIGQLAEAFSLDTSTVNRQTAAMLRSGLAERIPDPDGGLARKLRITEVGARRLAADREWSQEVIGSVLTDWTPAEIRQLAECLTHLNVSIEKREGHPWPRRTLPVQAEA
ncbi:MAG: MarR family winged helix-turn-helix transcriptional regulator [Streptosporangiaceae bacterium]